MGQVATVSCFLAAGPSRAADTLTAAMASTGRLGRPEAWFAPAAVPQRAAALGVPAGVDLAPRYLAAVVEAGRGEGQVWSAIASWTDMKWLLHAIRLDPATPTGGLDPEIVAARLPRLHYVLLVDDDKAATALEHRTSEHHDHQWVRWLEEAAVRDETRWRRFLGRSRAEVLELRASAVERDPAGAVALVAGWIGVEGDGPAHGPSAPPAKPAGVAAYLAERATFTPWPIPEGVGT